ncbi:hypothetical protein AZE42_06440 [Rhizopogon vesiculosus]|uniref:Uncharacterized protein n=1 Tax=Rhizopogon vesiculosus TaxID=180088 RepID=A0A1J8PQ53_9AGAM|nr:hypothetical protein AZE42_06440 [Rhizopogon vesiculosus]
MFMRVHRSCVTCALNLISIPLGHRDLCDSIRLAREIGYVSVFHHFSQAYVRSHEIDLPVDPYWSSITYPNPTLDSYKIGEFGKLKDYYGWDVEDFLKRAAVAS